MKAFLQILILIFSSSPLFSIGDCDNRPYCRDRSFYMTRNTGTAVHYMDVTNYDFHSDLRKGFTYEMRFKLTYDQSLPEKLFLAGAWGPFEDVNDSWVLYINSNSEIVFEINGSNTELGELDNTKASHNLADSLINRWYHVACVFDPNSESIRLYIDGILRDVQSNTDYPIDRLKRPTNDKYGIQIGSTNALYNDNSDFLSFLGEMDEIRIWNKPLNQTEIECTVKENYLGHEDGLSVYYRCNENRGEYEMCDATGNERFGQMRSNAECRGPSNPRWSEPEQYYFTELPSITEFSNQGGGNAFADTLKCVREKTYTWKFIDTGACSDVNYRVTGAKLIDGRWEWNRNRNGLSYTGRTPIENGIEHTAEITVDADFVGTERYRFLVIKDLDDRIDLNQQGVPNANRYQVCSRIMYQETEIYLTRITDFDYSKDTLDFGVLKANCIDEPFKEDTFWIKNNTINTGINQIMEVTDFQFNLPEYEIIEPSTPALIQPGDSVRVIVRFNSNNISGVYNDELRIITNDRCEDFRTIPMNSEIRDVITIFAGDNELESIDFGTLCVGPVVATQPFFWENLLDEDIIVKRIIYPQYFEGYTTNNETLEPQRAYQQKYFGFTPSIEGNFVDSIIVEIEAEGCTIRKPIRVQGIGLLPEYEISPIDTLDFGDVFIGQSRVRQIDVKNISMNGTSFRNYLFQGDIFEILTGTIRGIDSDQTRTINIEFKPLEAQQYYDNIRIEDNTCFDSYRVAIKGRGVIEAFNYEPAEVRIDNITACKDSTVSLDIINTYNQTLTLENFVLNDPSGRYSIVSPSNLLNSNFELDPNDRLTLELLYDPNDISGDRSDIAFIEYESLGENWSIQITGTSIVPRVYVTDEVAFGSLEITTTAQDTISVENITGADISISGFSLKDSLNFRIIKPEAPFDTILKPRETMEVVVEFQPDQPQFFEDSLFVLIDEPCEVPEEFAVGTNLNGFGTVIPLDINQIELSFGQVSPCECETKLIPLRNRSRDNPIRIDSVYFDISFGSNTLTSGNTEYFTWDIGGVNELPKVIEKGVVDSLFLTYCPRAPFIRDSLVHNAIVNVEASGPGWTTEDEVYVSGRQMLLYETIPDYTEFPPTRVDTFSVQRNSITTIPSTTFNEKQEPITVESIDFVPDENVFFYSSTFDDDFPMTFSSLDSFKIDIDFRPRSPREYRARMYINISSPCELIDSTVEVYGSGFAPAFGLDFVYKDTLASQPSASFNVANCDTLRLPVFTSRSIPGELVNIRQKLSYDTTVFKFEGIDSKYLDTSCLGYDPSYEFTIDTNNRINLQLWNFCNVDTKKEIYTAKFTSINGFDRGSRTFGVSDIFFDTEEVILFDIAATPAVTEAFVQKADFTILNSIDFGEVYILDCKRDSLLIQNTGDLPILVNDLVENIEDVEILDVNPPYGSVIQPDDSVKIIFEFCPLSKDPIDSTAIASVLNPCFLSDSSRIAGFGEAPDYEVSVDISNDFIEIDTIGGELREIIRVPIIFEKNLSVTYSDVEYWMTNLDFSVDFEYNPRALKYLEFESQFENTTVDANLGKIQIDFNGIDSLQAGTIGELTFEITLADSLFSDINILPLDFTSDIMFYDLIPNFQKAVVSSVGACNLTYLNFRDNITNLSLPSPNPITDKSTIEFTTLEDAEIILNVYDANGKIVKSFFNNGKIYDSGKYHINIEAKDFDAGVYYYTLQSGNFLKTQKMIIAK